jgi:hypothetical protein
MSMITVETARGLLGIRERARPRVDRDRHVTEEAAASLPSSTRSLTGRIVTWVKICADEWAAAALYDSLGSLSDTELHRQELSRDRLARDVFRSRDHVARG